MARCAGLKLEEWQAISPPCPACGVKEVSADECLKVGAEFFAAVATPVFWGTLLALLILLGAAFALGWCCGTASVTRQSYGGPAHESPRGKRGVVVRL